MRRDVLPAGHAPVRVLLPGEVVCAGAGERLQTLLGSCVSVVMTDPWRTVGAMCHIVHARRCAAATDAGARLETEWAGPALDTMYALLMRRGYQPRLCEAWVFGGGNMFPEHQGGTDVGALNAAWVMDRLAADGVRVTFSDVGGTCYRKLDWTVGTPGVSLHAVPMGDGFMGVHAPATRR